MATPHFPPFGSNKCILVPRTSWRPENEEALGTRMNGDSSLTPKTQQGVDISEGFLNCNRREKLKYFFLSFLFLFLHPWRLEKGCPYLSFFISRDLQSETRFVFNKQVCYSMSCFPCSLVIKTCRFLGPVYTEKTFPGRSVTHLSVLP